MENMNRGRNTKMSKRVKTKEILKNGKQYEQRRTRKEAKEVKKEERG